MLDYQQFHKCFDRSHLRTREAAEQLGFLTYQRHLRGTPITVKLNVVFPPTDSSEAL
jgi:hypothetical protein